MDGYRKKVKRTKQQKVSEEFTPKLFVSSRSNLDSSK